MSPEIVEAVARAEITHDYSFARFTSDEDKQKLINIHWPKYVARVTAVLAVAEPLIRQQARAEAFEEAAKVAEGFADFAQSNPDNKSVHWLTATDIGHAIRALANPAQPTAPAPPRPEQG